MPVPFGRIGVLLEQLAVLIDRKPVGMLAADVHGGALNDEAVKGGSRILSAYNLKSDTKIWVITEASDDRGRRATTTILLPEDY